MSPNSSSSFFQLDQDSLPTEDVQRRLEEQFKDKVCVHKAMQIVKNKSSITKKVSFNKSRY